SRVLFFESADHSIKNKKTYLAFAKAAFKQKRKMLKSNLMQYIGGAKELDLLRIMEELNLSKTARAEELTPAEFVDLYHRLGYL
ncbi:MAG: ribosomal RNA small subunit methyltransferase A, partial [Bdellovibrionales bacterium]|nr:ribosomal RNA small subunit methyltransferase A [Bdellovibrionales bacterium]